MKPRIGHWLLCSSVSALAACLNPLPDDTPSRADDGENVVPDTPSPGNTQGMGSNGEMPRPPTAPPDNSLDPEGESPANNGASAAPPDAGAPDAGAAGTFETTADSELVPDAGSSNEPP